MSKTVSVTGFRYNLRVKPTRRLRLELDAAAALYAAVALEYGRNSPSFNVCSSRLWQVLALAKACGPVAHEFA